MEALESDHEPAATLCAGSDSCAQNSWRILIVERDAQSVVPLESKLLQAGFSVTTLGIGEDAVGAVERGKPHLVMLDWDLPGVITMNLVRHIRGAAAGKTPRLIALSTYSGEQQVVTGFELGIDDYVVKPFSVAEVVARVRALLRPIRAAQDQRDYLEFRQLHMDTGEGRVTVDNRVVALRSMEYRLLEYLMRHPERAFDRETLLTRVWGPRSATDLRAIDVTIQRIRRALKPHGCDNYLQTIRSVGYRLSSPQQLAPDELDERKHFRRAAP
jgi:two-component system, OmpR family, phosphate regulon response regulator PhoB